MLFHILLLIIAWHGNLITFTFTCLGVCARAKSSFMQPLHRWLIMVCKHHYFFRNQFRSWCLAMKVDHKYHVRRMGHRHQPLAGKELNLAISINFFTIFTTMCITFLNSFVLCYKWINYRVQKDGSPITSVLGLRYTFTVFSGKACLFHFNSFGLVWFSCVCFPANC